MPSSSQFDRPIDAAVPVKHLNHRDLQSLQKLFGKKYGIRIAEAATGDWAIELKFEGEDHVYGLEGSRGMLKGWRSLSSAIQYVQQHCPSTAEVLVDIHGWRLMKIEEPVGLSIR